MSEVISFGIGSPWTKEQLQQARKMYAGRLSFHEIGRALNRSADAVSAAVAGSRVSLGRTIHIEREYGHYIGNPRIVIDRYASGATVTLQQSPWGMTRTRMEFLSPVDPAIDQFASELLNRVRLLGEREWERRERRERAKDEARLRRVR